LKALCKRTFFYDNELKWIRENYYETMIPSDYESENGVYIYVKFGENPKSYYPLNKSRYDKHFVGIDEIRNEKIENVLK